jgi:hypothetical protein
MVPAAQSTPAESQEVGQVTSTVEHNFESDADAIARSIDVDPALRKWPSHGWTTRAVWYDAPSQLTGIVSPAVGRDADIALAHGLALRSVGSESPKKLVLVLPEGHVQPTLRRQRWLAGDIDVWAHAGGRAVPAERAELDRRPVDDRPMMHLGDSSAQVSDLVEWLSQQGDLDDAHRPDKRAWQCRGQLVLVLSKAAGNGISIVAGSEAGADKTRLHKTVLAQGETLTDDELQIIVGIVQEAITKKLDARGRNEHWLQSIIRRRPGLLGLESPVLREVPAWRPIGDGADRAGAWGRGFIDLLALDGHGDLEIVETKVAQDSMMVLQGVDYLDWAERIEVKRQLAARLACAVEVPHVLHFVIGDELDGTADAGRYAIAQAEALRPEVSFRFSFVRNWRTSETPQVEMLALREPPKH